MVVFKRKTRMLNIRLSEEEYRSLREACMANGARSVSDFAREALSQSLRAAAPKDLRTSIERLAFELESLNSEVVRLRRMAGETGPVSVSVRQDFGVSGL